MSARSSAGRRVKKDQVLDGDSKQQTTNGASSSSSSSSSGVSTSRKGSKDSASPIASSVPKDTLPAPPHVKDLAHQETTTTTSHEDQFNENSSSGGSGAQFVANVTQMFLKTFVGPYQLAIVFILGYFGFKILVEPFIEISLPAMILAYFAFGMTGWCLVYSSRCDPGFVPKISTVGKNYVHPGWTVATETPTGIRGNRVCNKCGEATLKPDRSYHDNMYDRCILKMSHHCRAVNNTIGLNNHKAYLLFLTYSSLVACFVAFTALVVLQEQTLSKIPFKASSTQLLQIISQFTRLECVRLSFTIAMILIASSLSGFTAMHWINAMMNITSIESYIYEEYQEDWLKRYDLHTQLLNLEEVFGTVSWKWLIPLKTTKIDGLHWKVQEYKPAVDPQDGEQTATAPVSGN